MEAKRKVFIIDDHPIVREGLALLINQEPDLTICGEAWDAYSALEKLESARPDIVVLDLSLEGPDGLEVLKRIRDRRPDLAVLVLSMHDESIYAERALSAGAHGYIMKQEASEKVLEAIRRILREEIWVSEEIANRLLHRIVRGAAPEPDSPMDTLSDRELEVFRLIGAGHATRQIARQLNISVKTVESYQAHIKQKLSLKNARELIQYAIEWTIQPKH